ncbi:hypothetical protein CkaCkLH20_07495 [Colletotrichum karsti]|uniref:Uncharacterized protein n=1 Tax=Colletotrichum karsti TaxID=1095194 RepID=A0A9P6I383_9PEZI|nr:uncharacterized protein CkaCkLH20_07495 [Colletotrichum karsti]KAF9875229.1 hypothetical protein CkaCkLH20_07495 [Colletotrichum karsti]
MTRNIMSHIHIRFAGDPLSRAVFFVASCVSLAYVLTHVIASKTAYIKNQGSPRAYGKYVSGLAFLLARLGLPVWVAAVTLTIFVAVNIGLDVSKGVQQNIPWLNVIISIASLFSLAAVLAAIEMADRPFATIGLSQSWFVRGEDPLSPEQDDMEPGLVEVVSMIKDKPVPSTFKEKKQRPSFKDKNRRMVLSTIQEKREQKEKAKSNAKPMKPPKRKRKTLTKKNPNEAAQRRALRSLWTTANTDDDDGRRTPNAREETFNERRRLGSKLPPSDDTQQPTNQFAYFENIENVEDLADRLYLPPFEPPPIDSSTRDKTIKSNIHRQVRCAQLFPSENICGGKDAVKGRETLEGNETAASGSVWSSPT